MANMDIAERRKADGKILRKFEGMDSNSVVQQYLGSTGKKWSKNLNSDASALLDTLIHIESVRKDFRKDNECHKWDCYSLWATGSGKSTTLAALREKIQAILIL